MDDIEDLLGQSRSSEPRDTNGEVLIKRTSNRQARARKTAVGYDIPGAQTIYVKTYGCGHNFSDGEYMAGQLVAHGYGITEDFDAADAYLLNSCTVKNPSEAHFHTLVASAKQTGKPVIVAGCVPQGDQKNSAWDDLSVIGVQQINRVVEVVQEALRGNQVHLFQRTKKNRPGLDLPKVRRNRWIEIIPINVGCLNQCTYCKTKHARGNLSSWPIDEICARVKQVVSEGVKEIRLTSEDTGAYGRDIGTNIGELLKAVVTHIPDGVMLRLGMTNPPYMLEHLDVICDTLNHPNVYSYLHIPVQAGSNRVLGIMQREYTVQEFKYIVQKLRERVPGVNIATDIICGFPGETEEDFKETAQLCEEMEFPFLNISQFYARQGTPAASMKPLDSKVIKARSRKITQIFEAQATCATKHQRLVGTTQRVYITEMANDGHHLVGHTKCYTQVLIPPDEAEIGMDVKVQIAESSKWSVKGKVVDDGAGPKQAPKLPPLVSLVPEHAGEAAPTGDNGGSCCTGTGAHGSCCGAAGPTTGGTCCGGGDTSPNSLEPNFKNALVVLGLSALVLLGISAWRRSR
uniref:Threonylcarbamoyladenosine tRNA methylthiotransferase n=1 Tax=Eutreptiella gymnastica TaxID=73025 RepID=A0A7S1NLL5_9EUGL|mmetsp:Transcript_57668/g.103047  ORF Transcript_57668/g.103047 Transcript_57668/m.103047 type:complete len:573 (+) Transcript_57668:110-1828(+)